MADEQAPNATDAAVEFAKENDIDLSTVTGTGQNGRITKDDVEAAAAGDDADAGAAEAEPTSFNVIGADGRSISRGLSKSAADELAARVRAATKEKVKVEPVEPEGLPGAAPAGTEKPPPPEPS